MNSSIFYLEVENIQVKVIYKNIKNINLRVHMPDGQVIVSAPFYIEQNFIRSFVESKLSWIRKQQQKSRNYQPKEELKYQNHENHYFQGQSYLLKVIEHNLPPKIELVGNKLELHIRPHTGLEKKQQILSAWYRQQLTGLIPPLIAQYEQIMGVKVKEFNIKQMKTRWGSCNPRSQRICLNLELAKKPLFCLEYVTVHEMAHLIEPSHNAHFWGLLDSYLPQWKIYKAELNR